MLVRERSNSGRAPDFELPSSVLLQVANQPRRVVGDDAVHTELEEAFPFGWAVGGPRNHPKPSLVQALDGIPRNPRLIRRYDLRAHRLADGNEVDPIVARESRESQAGVELLGREQSAMIERLQVAPRTKAALVNRRDDEFCKTLG